MKHVYILTKYKHQNYFGKIYHSTIPDFSHSFKIYS